MVGSAVPTIVLSIAAISSASIRPAVQRTRSGVQGMNSRAVAVGLERGAAPAWVMHRLLVIHMLVSAIGLGTNNFYNRLTSGAPGGSGMGRGIHRAADRRRDGGGRSTLSARPE